MLHKAHNVFMTDCGKYVKKAKQEEEKKEREGHAREEKIERKRRFEEKWALIRWITKNIEQNIKRWETDDEISKRENGKLVEDWERNSRLVKIEMLKENLRREKDVPKLCLEGLF